MGIEERFAARLRAVRKRKGYTQDQLAERAGIDYKYLQMLEGKTPSSVTLRTLEKLANALGMQPWRLLQFAPERKRAPKNPRN